MISEYLSTENIIINLESSEKEEAFAELLEVLKSQDKKIDRNSAMEALIERENKMSTAVFPNIAIPHAVCKSLENTVLALGISKQGIPFESTEKNNPKDNNVNIIFEILFSEKDSQSRIYMLRDILKLISNQVFLQQILNADSVYEVIDIIKNLED